MLSLFTDDDNKYQYAVIYCSIYKSEHLEAQGRQLVERNQGYYRIFPSDKCVEHGNPSDLDTAEVLPELVSTQAEQMKRDIVLAGFTTYGRAARNAIIARNQLSVLENTKLFAHGVWYKQTEDNPRGVQTHSLYPLLPISSSFPPARPYYCNFGDFKVDTNRVMIASHGYDTSGYEPQRHLVFVGNKGHVFDIRQMMHRMKIIEEYGIVSYSSITVQIPITSLNVNWMAYDIAAEIKTLRSRYETELAICGSVPLALFMALAIAEDMNPNVVGKIPCFSLVGGKYIPDGLFNALG